MRLQQHIARNDNKFKKIKGININENTMEISKDYVGSYHVLEMGQHYLDYGKPNNLLPELGKGITNFPISDILKKLKNKTKAPGVTGNMGEIIAGIVASRTFKIPTLGMAHLEVSGGRTPDYLLKNTKGFENFLLDNSLACQTETTKFPDWWLMESKASIDGTASISNAHKQLRSFWYRMIDDYPNWIGYGIAVGTSIVKKTIKIRIYIPDNQNDLFYYFKFLRHLRKNKYMDEKCLLELVERPKIDYFEHLKHKYASRHLNRDELKGLIKTPEKELINYFKKLRNLYDSNSINEKEFKETIKAPKIFLRRYR